MIDLHIHSTNSDGSEEPPDLVRDGVKAGLRAMALTDHDTMDGAEDFLAECRKLGMTGIAGIEISGDPGDDGGTLHILGYGMDPECPELVESLEKVREGRQWRNERILEKLNELGLELDRQEVAACSGDDVVGRVHFAQAMESRGYVSSIPEAFEKYLGNGAPAYVSRYRLYPAEAVRLFREAGGAAVVAHPFSWTDDMEELERKLIPLRDAGLYGIEAMHPEATAEQSIALMRLAKKLGLRTTGGSDFHGAAKPDITLGCGFGRLAVPDEWLPPLLEAIDAPRNPRVAMPARQPGG